MNIHIDQVAFEELKTATILSIKMGSRMYNLENSSSDTDMLHIIATPTGWTNSLVWTHHNLQYKENGVDHVFTTLQNFVRNILKGDSTINYECLYSKEIENSSLAFLSDMRLKFNNYSLIRSYLGLVRRDLKNFSQGYDSKKLFHAVRGLWTANQIMKNTYSNDIKQVDLSIYTYLHELKNGIISDRRVLIEKVKEISKATDSLRAKLTELLNNKLMNRIMEPSSLKSLDEKLKQFCLTKDYTEKIISDIEVTGIYQIINTDITYT